MNKEDVVTSIKGSNYGKAWKVRLQSSRVDRAAWRWESAKRFVEEGAYVSSRAGGRRRSMKPSS